MAIYNNSKIIGIMTTTNKIMIIIGAVVTALMMFLYKQNEDLKSQLLVFNQNQKALLDSIHEVKDEMGRVTAYKASFIAKGEELKQLNEDLYNEVKRLQGDVKFIQKSVSNIKLDPIILTNNVIEYPDGTKEMSWMYDTTYNVNNSRLLEGSTKFSIDSLGKIIDKGTTIKRDELKMSFTTGLTQEKGVYKIFVNSDYPNFKIEKIEGSILDQNLFIKSEEDDFIFGPQFGLGFGTNFTPQIYIGAGITYNLNKHIKKIFKK
jgi:hypothetical protein